MKVKIENLSILNDRRRVNFIYESVSDIIEGKVFGKRGRGRSSNLYLEDNKYHMRIGNFCDMKRAALDRRE